MSASTDGRNTRWERHRQERRGALVDACVEAVRQHGPGVGMDEIATVAGTSKTVIYRYFTDRAGLYRAVAERVDAQIVARISAAVQHPAGSAVDPRAVLHASIDAYLALIERDPELYRFILNPPLTGASATAGNSPENSDTAPADPLTRLSDTVAGLIAGVYAGPLTERWHDPAIATIWAHGMVGLVRAAADSWLAQHPRTPREQLSRTLTDLTWHGASLAYRSEE